MRRLILIIALVGCMGAAPVPPAPEAPRAPAASTENPLLGKWRWSVKDGSCRELHEYRADGTATSRSGDEVLEKRYTVELHKGGPFFLYHEEVTARNGGKDCLGHSTAVGKQAGMFVLPSNDGGYYTCWSDEGMDCFGSAIADK